MLMLLKYNWKLNSQTFYIMLVSLAALYTMMLIGSFNWGWYDELIFAFGIALAGLGVLLSISFAAVSFNHSLKSYHRRMLPVQPLSEIGAILLQAILYGLIVVAISAIYFLLLYIGIDSEGVAAAYELLLKPIPVMSIIVHQLLLTISLTTLLILSIACSYTVKGKYRSWIGVAAFIAFSFIADSIARWITGPSYDQRIFFIRFDETQEQLTLSESMPYQWFDFFSWSVLLELLFIVIGIMITQYLLKKRTEC